jgi:hypothetical protein
MGLVRVKTVLLLATCAIVAMVIATSIFAERLNNIENATFDKTISVSPGITQGSERLADEAPSNIQVVLLSLRPEGFEPTEMQLPLGDYLFVVRNRTGLDEVNVRLAGESGQPMLAAKVGLRRQDLKQRLHLALGTYRLTEKDHPDWTCTIVVRQ